MNKNGFFVSLTSLLVLIVLVSLVLVNQTLNVQRSASKWDETKKELVSELVLDLEKAMIPTSISSSIKNNLVTNSPSMTTKSNIILNINTDFDLLEDNIDKIFTIPLDDIAITVKTLDIQQIGPFLLEARVTVDYSVKSGKDKWSNTNIPYKIPISVIGITHPSYPTEGAITTGFWNVWSNNCVLDKLVSGTLCSSSYGICPVKLEWCENYEPQPVIVP